MNFEAVVSRVRTGQFLKLDKMQKQRAFPIYKILELQPQLQE